MNNSSVNLVIEKSISRTCLHLPTSQRAHWLSLMQELGGTRCLFSGKFHGFQVQIRLEMLISKPFDLHSSHFSAPVIFPELNLPELTFLLITFS